MSKSLRERNAEAAIIASARTFLNGPRSLAGNHIEDMVTAIDRLDEIRSDKTSTGSQ